MLSFDTFQKDNKDLGYSARPDDLHSDLFDELFCHDSTQLTSDVEASEGFETFDFGFDEAPTSHSQLGKDRSLSFKSLESQSPSTKPFRHSASAQPLRSRRTQPPSEPQNPAISCDELLGLEGKAYISAQKASPASATPSLRRKGKFCSVVPELRGRGPGVAKSPSSDMIRPSYGCPNQMPSYQDWTQKFEQITLQTPETGLGMPIPPSTNGNEVKNEPSTFNESFTNNFNHRKSASENAVSPYAFHSAQALASGPSTSHPALQASAGQANSQQDAFSSSYFQGTDDFTQSFDTGVQPSCHPTSWGQAPASFVRHDVAVSPRHIHPSWVYTSPEKSDAYATNQSSLQTTSASEFPLQDVTEPFDPFSFINSPDAPNGIAMYPPQELQTTAQRNSTYSTDECTFTGMTRPQTPPSRTPSTSPPAPDTPQSARRPKSHRRRPKLGSLRLPKSSVNLRSSKSGHNLRSPKSAGALKSPKSSGGLKSPGEYNFVNFTSDDSRRILTGVAPSGSSKTKARREQEANDKKRRLSQIAVRAVAEAGGDVEALRKEGLEELLL